MFDLPEGVTVNSVQAHIVNNRFVPPIPEPVPATSTRGLALMALAMLVIGSTAAALWRQRSRAGA